VDNGTFEQWTSIVLDRERLASGGWTTGRAVAVVHCSKREGRRLGGPALRGGYQPTTDERRSGGAVRRGVSLLVFDFTNNSKNIENQRSTDKIILVFVKGINRRAVRK